MEALMLAKLRFMSPYDIFCRYQTLMDKRVWRFLDQVEIIMSSFSELMLNIHGKSVVYATGKWSLQKVNDQYLGPRREAA